MSQNSKLDTKKKLVMAAALAGLIGGVTLNSKVAFAGDKAGATKAEKKAGAKCADGSCGDKKEKKAKAKCADGSCGDKKDKDKKKKKSGAKCADGSCGDKK